MHKYEELEVWQVAYELTRSLYDDTRGFPADERFVLVPQIRRAGISVPANIAEGSGRATPGEFRNLLSIASGSNRELDLLIRLSGDLGYLQPPVAAHRRSTNARVYRMLGGFILSLRSTPKRH